MKLSELFQSLSEAKVNYVLVGGLAIQLHGFMRSTFDVDLVLDMSDENLERFIAVAEKYGLVPAIPVPICLVPCDYIPVRSYALFEARSLLREVFNSLA